MKHHRPAFTITEACQPARIAVRDRHIETLQLDLAFVLSGGAFGEIDHAAAAVITVQLAVEFAQRAGTDNDRASVVRELTPFDLTESEVLV